MRDCQDLLGGRPDWPFVEEDLKTIYALLVEANSKGEGELPSVSCTVTSCQKRFCRTVLGLDFDARPSWACFNRSACLLFLATLSSASEVGAWGGGPGTAGCGSV
jgi:hypothetical protein